jgi:hypothetical protein
MASTSRSAYFPRPLFGKSMLAPALRDITVDNVLAGDTCSPIGSVLPLAPSHLSLTSFSTTLQIIRLRGVPLLCRKLLGEPSVRGLVQPLPFQISIGARDLRANL